MSEHGDMRRCRESGSSRDAVPFAAEGVETGLAMNMNKRAVDHTGSSRLQERLMSRPSAAWRPRRRPDFEPPASGGLEPERSGSSPAGLCQAGLSRLRGLARPRPTHRFGGVQAFLFLLVILIEALIAAQVHAQMTPGNLLSNLHVRLSSNTGSSTFRAQRFRTGTNDTGYTVTAVRLSLRDASGKDISVVIRENDNGEPGDLVATLTNPDSLTSSADNEFTAPEGTTLEPSTDYWVSVHEGVTDDRASVGSAFFNSFNGEPGWSLVDDAKFRFSETNSWSNSSARMKMAVRGYANEETATNSAATGEPGIGGTAQVGQTLTAELGTIDDDDGLPSGTFPTGYTFQWVRVASDNTEADIPGATAQTYTVAADDVGSTLKVKVTFTDGGGNEETLASAPTAVVTQAQQSPLTARLSHIYDADREAGNGQIERAFTLQLGPGAFVNPSDLRDHGFETVNGTVFSVTRVESTCRNIGGRRYCGQYQAWVRSIDRNQQMSVTIPAAASCSVAGAPCGEEGGTVQTPKSLVWQAGVTSGREVSISAGSEATKSEPNNGCNRQLLFEISLSKKSRRYPVLVDFETLDDDSDTTATPGTQAGSADYWPQSYTVMFVPGERTLKAGVQICADSINESSETVKVRISNARMLVYGNSTVTPLSITTATATGTIANDGPIPKAWLARFGRAVSEQVLDAVGDRLASAPRAGAELSLAGQKLPSVSGAADGPHTASREEPREAEARAGLAAVTDRLRGDAREDGYRGFGARAVTNRDLLTGTSFSLASGGAGGGGHVAVWGRGALTRFEGSGDGLSVDGEVATGMAGGGLVARFRGRLVDGRVRGGALARRGRLPGRRRTGFGGRRRRHRGVVDGRLPLWTLRAQ